MPDLGRPPKRPQGPRPLEPRQRPARDGAAPQHASEASSRALPPLPIPPPLQAPVEPSEGSGRSRSRYLATENQHLLLRLATWFLSKTNNLVSKDNSTAETGAFGSPTGGTAQLFRDKKQRYLYERTEALCLLLERNHESITALPTNYNARHLLVSRTHSSQAPVTFDHYIWDHKEVLLFGQTLELREELWLPLSPCTEEEAARQAAKEAKNINRTSESSQDQGHISGSISADPVWGYDQKAFNATCFGTFENDAPFPQRTQPYALASDHGFWLMHHTLEMVDEDTFISDVTFREHMSNVVDGIKRTHAHPEDSEATLKANINLAMYIYLNCATRSHEKMTRGFNEYSYGRMLSCSADNLLQMDPEGNDRTARFVEDDDRSYELSTRAKILTSEQRSQLQDILQDGLFKCGVYNELLDPSLPDGLLNRDCFYDVGGRVHFHELLRTILVSARDSVNTLVETKKTLMMAKHNRNSQPLSSERSQELNDLLSVSLNRVVLSFQMLHVLCNHFAKVLNSHVAWICDIMAEKDDGFFLRYQERGSRPEGLYDEFGTFVKVPKPGDGNKLVLSIMDWLNLLCQQENAMERLRRPIYAVGQALRRADTKSFHVKNSWPLYLRVFPATDRYTMANLGNWLSGPLGYTKEEQNHLLKYLVRKGIFTQAEAEGRGLFKGCVHASAGIFCLSYLQRRRSMIEMSKADLAKLEIAGLEDQLAPQLPDRAITDMVPSQLFLAVGRNKPFCGGCRMMLQRALLACVYPGKFAYNRVVAEEWAQFDLPPWAPRDAIHTLIAEANNEAFKRVDELLRQAAGDREGPLSTLE